MIFDELVRGCLQAICNIKMDPDVWAQATLPTSKGGLGVRCSVDLAIPAFLASSFATADLVSSILSSSNCNSDPLVQEALDLWQQQADSSPPPLEVKGRQWV